MIGLHTSPLAANGRNMNQTLYGLYEWMSRSFYVDDGGGSDSSETLCFVHSDPEYIRTAMNKLWESPDLFEGRGRTQMQFVDDSLSTNVWFSNGGGCAAQGGYHIREMKKHTAEAYIAAQQAVIDKAQASRDRMAAEAAAREEKERERQRHVLERQRYYAKRRDINAKKRERYAANKDEINAKRRVYRAKKAAEKREADAERRRRWEAFDVEWKAFRETDHDRETRSAKWSELLKKHKLLQPS